MEFPAIDPVALQLGPLAIHWYGLMYLLGFAAAWWIIRRWAREPGSGWSDALVDDLIFWGALGVVVGGRIGYLLFYNADAVLDDPLVALRIWQGGMSFHGGLIGVTAAMAWFAHRNGLPFLDVMDKVARVTPIGLGAGRLGNFINSELWGRVTEVPWGMIFPNGGPAPRHPSQLYEFALEGVALFVLLNAYARRRPPTGSVAALLLVGYGVFRFVVEFYRVPDAHIGYIAFGWLTRGQLLCVPMVLIGLAVWGWLQRRGARA